MQKVFEKIIERLKELKTDNSCRSCQYREKCNEVQETASESTDLCGATMKSLAIEIVNQVAEEYKHVTTCYLQSPCEYQNEDIRVDDSIGWIPCSERLPNGSELWLGHDITDAEPREFIVMVKGAYEPTTGYYTDDGWVKDIYDKENGIIYANEIVAWRFFPEPYKAESEE